MRWTLDRSPLPGRPAAVLDPEQAAVVAHRSGPLLVLAGPGTGKTTTIVEAVAARLTEPDDPAVALPASSVLVLTFGRRAAVELRDRLAMRLGGGLLPTVATFHSFAYGLLAQTTASADRGELPRLMSGAEEDVRIRDLLVGGVESGRITWPDDLAAALPTLGLANEVRAVLARARELDLSPTDLERIAREAKRPEWAAVAELAREERDVVVLENVMDYAELLRLAVVRAGWPEVQSALHQRYRAIYVDEYQDTDPLQVRLLQRLVAPGAALVAVGDPDQAIYGFRGADVSGLLQFPEQFRTSSGAPAPVIALTRTRRFGPRVRAAAAGVLGSAVVPGLPTDALRAHRSPVCVERDEPAADAVTLHAYDSAGALAGHVAREVRRAHLDRGVPWRECAVLVRSGQQIAALQRALAAAGVPVVVAHDEIPLKDEPAVSALLSVLELAARPKAADAQQVLDALTGPLIALDPSDLRRLGRALRARDHREGYATPASADLIRAQVLDDPEPAPPLPLDDPAIVGVRALRALVRTVHDELTRGAPPQEVLWTLWTGGRHRHGWPERLRAAALSGSRSASHDLDAVMALFDAAERLTGRYPGFLGVRMFLDVVRDQQLPSESVADRAPLDDAVRILTAHRAKGLEWDEVWVVGAQEGTWPDLRPRGSTLRAQDLASHSGGSAPTLAQALAEERRLFYVACTRARRQLHVAVVDEGDDGDMRPSVFVADLQRAGVPLQVEHGRPAHAHTLAGLVADLRTTAADPAASASLREAAVARLAALARAVDDDGHPLVPQAHPDQWWGIGAPTPGAAPVVDPMRPVAMSGSRLDGLLECPLRSFLTKQVHADSPRGAATAFGSVVHAVADFVAKEQVPPDLSAMEAELDRVWPALTFDSRWQGQAERDEAAQALRRFLMYHQRHDRTLIDTEASMNAVVEVPLPSGGTDAMAISGFIDRVERDADGRLVPIDLKNMSRPPSGPEVDEHGQLGLYQLLIREGGYEAEPDAVPGGAALVQLRVNAGAKDDGPKVQLQSALGDETPSWIEQRLGQAAQVMRTEEFVARPSRQCAYCAFRRVCPAQIEGEAIQP